MLLLGDCLKKYKEIEKHSIDLILADPPYGTTACPWDSVIPFDEMWEMIEYLVKPTGNILLFGNNPFSANLITSNLKCYKQTLIWSKGKGTTPLLAKKRVMQSHEDIILFNQSIGTYNPQMSVGKPYKAPKTGGSRTNNITGLKADKSGWTQKDNTGTRYPLSVLNYSMHCGSKIHPTQKPETLLTYLIKTYSNQNQTVLDFCMGSGSTGIAAYSSGRKFIGIEMDSHYYNIALNRINKR